MTNEPKQADTKNAKISRAALEAANKIQFAVRREYTEYARAALGETK